MALSDFFPYGAPELLKDSAARMARSTLGSSLLVTLLIVAVGAMRPSSQIDVEQVWPKGPIHELLPPPEADPPPAAERTQRVVSSAKPPLEKPAEPELVPDDLLQEPDPVGRLDPGAPPVDPCCDGEPAGGTVAPAAPETDPEPGMWVDVDELPSPLRCAAVPYPDLARAAGVEGTVRVRMLIGSDGRVERALIEPNGSVLLLDEAALEAARSCRFTPAQRGGRAVKVWVVQAYRFTLH